MVINVRASRMDLHVLTRACVKTAMKNDVFDDDNNDDFEYSSDDVGSDYDE